MGVFDDKKFEELDWISQTTEPIDSALNEYLKAIPEEVTITYNDFMSLINDRYGFEVNMNEIIKFYISKFLNKTAPDIKSNEREELIKCFSLKLTGEEMFIDFEKRQIIGGEVKLIKNSSTMDEKTLADLLGRDGIYEVSNIWSSHDSCSRMNEIMDLLGGCESGLKTRSFRKKKWELVTRLTKLFKNNEWNIKDTTLANKVGFWVARYVSYGDLSALSNFCRLKVMTHKGLPIYSMEEVV